MLRGWRESPVRFREDANAEDDAARVGYRDRLLIELLANANDAAASVGVQGRVRVRLQDRELRVANTGSTLTRDGLVGLATLRASAKRDESGVIGRFGAGFSAVLAVTDEPSIVSGAVAVSWSAARTRTLLAGDAGLAAELSRRGGQVPVLRLPFADGPTPDPADGYDTEVRLPLRDEAALASVTSDLEALAPVLLLVFTSLVEIVIEASGSSRVLSVVRAGDTAETRRRHLALGVRREGCRLRGRSGGWSGSACRRPGSRNRLVAGGRLARRRTQGAVRAHPHG